MRPQPRERMTGSPGTETSGSGPFGCKGGGQRLLMEGSRRIHRLLERSPVARSHGFKAVLPEPRSIRRRLR